MSDPVFGNFKNVLKLPVDPQGLVYWIGGDVGKSQRFLLQTSREQISVSQLPVAQRRLAIKKIDDQQQQELLQRASKAPDGYRMAKLFHYPKADAVFKNIRHLARVRLARTAVAIERCRLMSKTLPEALEDLVPPYLNPVPRNPFSGKPLQFKKQDKGYTVSVETGLADADQAPPVPEVKITIHR